LLVSGAVVFALSRTGGPLCRPESLLQGHALWHLATAGALAAWGISALPDPALEHGGDPGEASDQANRLQL